MDCEKFAGKLGDFLESDLEPQEMKTFQEHMSGCQVCRKIFESHQAIADRLAKSGNISPSPEFRSKVMEKISDGSCSPSVSPSPSPPASRILIAALIVSIPIGFCVWNLMKTHPNEIQRKPLITISSPVSPASFSKDLGGKTGGISQGKQVVASQSIASQAVGIDKTPE